MVVQDRLKLDQFGVKLIILPSTHGFRQFSQEVKTQALATVLGTSRDCKQIE